MDKNVIAKICNYFKDKPVLKAYLFGSEARNEASTDSDVDILIELDHSKPVGLKYIKMQLELENILHRHVDLVSKPSKYIMPRINKEKILIYEK
ncbi:nucleotidyltransferase family protein [Candidatus Margulisiibacteriota bacterium]